MFKPQFSLEREKRMCFDFVRRTGTSEFQVYNSAGTITAGDAVQFDESGECVVAATGKAVIGVAVADATSSTTVTVDVAKAGHQWVVDIESGTMADAEIGQEADLNSADGITLTESNNDVHIVGWDRNDTAKAYVIFKKLALGETVAA